MGEGLKLDTNTIIAYLACIFFLFLFGKLFILPIKSILKLIGNSILGAIMLYIVNLVGNIFGFHIGINVITAIFTGILGLPRSDFISNIKIMDGIKKLVAFKLLIFLPL